MKQSLKKQLIFRVPFKNPSANSIGSVTWTETQQKRGFSYRPTRSWLFASLLAWRPAGVSGQAVYFLYPIVKLSRLSEERSVSPAIVLSK